jgi:hypothetical protein
MKTVLNGNYSMKLSYTERVHVAHGSMIQVDAAEKQHVCEQQLLELSADVMRLT